MSTEPAKLTRQVEELKARIMKRGIPIEPVVEIPIEIDPKTTTEKRMCLGCQLEFDSTAIVIDGAELCRKSYCEPCIRVKDEENEKEYQRQFTLAAESAFRDRWEKLCPPRYAQPFDIQKIIEVVWMDIPKAARPDRRVTESQVDIAVDKIQHWPYSERGLGLVGPSGHGKTRIMFLLMKRFLREGRGCEYINLAVFGREIGSKFSQGADKANDWIKKLCKVPVLFLDDVGKEKMTERVETELYGIIEMRSAYMLPIFFTANVRGDALIKKMTVTRHGEFGNEVEETSDRAIPIVRRLREFCEGVTI